MHDYFFQMSVQRRSEHIYKEMEVIFVLFAYNLAIVTGHNEF